ncbi:unnamed protein product, partial [Rotaria sp. Silwood1]
MATNIDTTATQSTTMNFSVAGETLEFGNNKTNILAYWKQINAFQTSNKLFKDRPNPPFATDLPHYGCILAAKIKDTVTRWAYQTGHHVERRFGWAKMSIAAYKNHCRQFVIRYVQEWEITPHSIGCCTLLSNFEVDQNYKNTNDLVVWVSFPLVDDLTVKLVAWTTTPWTLPLNLALCVNPNSVYVKILDKMTNEVFILMKKRLFEYRKVDFYSLKESHLKEMHYTPLFSYFADVRFFSNIFLLYLIIKIKTAFHLLCDEYFTKDSGTAVVHQVPYFGEDDYRVCLVNDVINKDTGSVVCPIDAPCRFTDEAKDFQGQNVKDADKAIIKYLEE